jgi:hypothetical protein
LIDRAVVVEIATTVSLKVFEVLAENSAVPW